MAPLIFFVILLLGTSYSSANPALACSVNNRQMSITDRIGNLLQCLREQGHDEELLSELKRSFDNKSTLTCAGCPSDEQPNFPYCSGMTDLQCRTLMLVLESLLGIPSQSKFPDGKRSLEETLGDSSGRAQGDSEDQDVQAALMKVIMARFNDILDDYRRWRINNESRRKRSSQEVTSPAEADDKSVDESTSGPTPEKPELDKVQLEEVRSSRRRRSLRSRRQALPFKLPDKLTPEMQLIVEEYLAWKEKNGSGKMSGRWG